VQILFVICFLLSTVACSREITHGFFESRAGGEENNFIFDKSRFIFKKKNSTDFLCEGSWIYSKKYILLNTDLTSKPDTHIAVGDTMWVDLTGKRMRVLTKNKLNFEGVIYYRRR
jgi:hypothetical protein